MPTPRTVLMLSASPKGTAPLRLDEELREVKEGLIKRAKLRDNFSLVSEHAVRARDVHRAMLDHQPYILHFSGHGAGTQGLILEDEMGGGKEVSGEAIAQLFALFKDSLQCVLLNACYSEVQAKAIHEHIPFVIGMSDEIGDKAAIEFAVAFYDAIGAGKDIRFAFDLATVAIKMAGIDQDHVPVLLSKEADTPPPLPTSATITFSTYNPDTFTGREEETRVICEQLQRNCRIIAIVGMTGVGKTALAERAIAQLAGDGALPYVRFSLDDRSIGADFTSSGTALLRALGDEPTLEDQKDPANLVGHILSRLQNHPCRLQIDSMERLLKGDEQDGWSEFCDPLWLSLLQRVLSAGECGSQVILTTQDIPGELEGVGDRFNQLWHCQTLQGLSQQEQVELFRKLGLEDNQERLKRIGEFYDGHPLVLQVIADEIKQRPFNGNIQAYWERYGEEFEALTPAGKVDRSRVFRTRVRQRVELTIDTLPEPARQLLSACSVFRRPAPEMFWIEMGEGSDPYIAFDLLKGRNLIEYVDLSGQPSLIRLHNLIRSVAYGLLKRDLEVWETAERKAANLWLTAYVAPDDAPKIEAVRGYLEAFDHFCEVGDWKQACSVLEIQINSPTQDPLHWQLETWGYYQEQIRLYKKVIGKTSTERDILWLRGLGLAYRGLGDYTLTIQSHQQSLKLARSIGDRSSEAKALGNLGIAYLNLGQYQQAINLNQQWLSIAQEIGDRKGEGASLGNLGNAYHSLGQFHQAIDLYQQQRAITEEISDRRGEGASLGNLGIAYHSLGRFYQAIDFHQQWLSIAQEISDRRGEGQALGNLGIAYHSLGQFQQAIDFHQRWLSIAQEISDRRGEGQALGNLGIAYYSLGQFHRAIDFQRQRLAIAQEIGDRKGEAIALVNMGETLRKLQQFPKSLTHTQAAFEIFQDISFREGEAEALFNLAKTHQNLNATTQALHLCHQALSIVSDLGIPLKAECEKLLEELAGNV